MIDMIGMIGMIGMVCMASLIDCSVRYMLTQVVLSEYTGSK